VIGRALRRVEDRRLLTGRGRYAADGRIAGCLHLAFVRSHQARARLVRLDGTAASARPGVLAVWSAADVAELVPAPATALPGLPARGRQPVLAAGEVDYAGQPIAVVVAESEPAAADARDDVEVELEPLPPVPGMTGPDAVEAAGGDRYRFGDVEAAFAGAAVTVRARFDVERVCGAAMEPRAVTVVPEEDGSILVRTSTQNVFGVRRDLARALGLPESRVRVVAEDVGGAFGVKWTTYPEEILAAFAAHRLARPVRWVATRSEDGATTLQGHGNVVEAEVAADADGTLRGLRGTLTMDLGAYACLPSPADNIVLHTLSAYRWPAAEVEVRYVYTNAVPTTFVRGGGKEVGNFVGERMLDLLADRIGASRADVRAHNLVRPQHLPYRVRFDDRTPLTYDGGDYPAMLGAVRRALAAEEVAPGRGVGVACYVERTGFGRGEPARLRVLADGRVRVSVGSSPSGQGHRTMVAQVVAERLGWPLEEVEVTVGDTAEVPFAAHTAAARSSAHVGGAAAQAALEARRRLLELAADRLEAAPADLRLASGVVSVAGAPARCLPAADLVGDAGLEVLARFSPEQQCTFASGCLGVVVEVDVETLEPRVVRAVLAHDCGRVINPLTVAGQLHGGLAHGLGYALYEEASYGSDGTFRSASFLDYVVPGVAEVPDRFEAIGFETPSPGNPEGVRGAGESATMAAPAAVASAVEEALRRADRPVRLTRLPITPASIAGAPGAGA
jgi:carbon-monoxide dehydrogenase large subunit